MKLLERLSLLRRLVLAQERQASALERIASYLEPPKVERGRAKRAELSTLDVDWLNQQHEEEQEARMRGYSPDDEE